MQDKTADKDEGAHSQEPKTQDEKIMQLYLEMDRLREERDNALTKLKEGQLLNNVLADKSTCKLYTGLSPGVFQCLFDYMDQFVPHSHNKVLSNKEELLLTLIKFRQNPGFEFLGGMFRKTPKSTTWDIFWRWTDLLYSKIKFMIKWPDRENIFHTIPPAFKSKYPRLTSIIDCFELFIDAPSTLNQRLKHILTTKSIAQ